MKNGAQLIRILLPALSLLAGCVVVPLPHPAMLVKGVQLPERSTNPLQPGVTTRQDVLLTLGTPTRVEANERYYFYLWTTSTVAVAFGSIPPMAASADVPTEKWFVCLEFGPDGRLVRWERFKEGTFSPSENDTLKAWMEKSSPTPPTGGGSP